MSKNEIFCCNLKAPAPIGMIVIIGNIEGEVTNLYIGDSLKNIPQPDAWVCTDAIFPEAREQLAEYFEGKRKQFQLQIRPKGTSFQLKVWQELCEIPYGEVRSYKQVAVAIGEPNSYRAVGTANGRNPIPIIIPCHRVVGTNSKNKGGYSSGIYVKNFLLNLEKIHQVFLCLSDHYGELNWWKTSSAFEVMIEAILAQNTNWKNVIKSMRCLKDMLVPQQLIRTPRNIIARTIKASGYYRKKAEIIQSLCLWFGHYSFDVKMVQQIDGKTLRKEHLLIKGIGPETADCILNYALSKPYFVIDAYTTRILKRVGVDLPKTYDKIQSLIERIIPKSADIYKKYHGLMVEHAKLYCKNIPRCLPCPAVNICARGKNNLKNE